MKYRLFTATLLSWITSGFSASAEDIGIAKPWELNLQEPATPVMEKLVHAHNYLLVLITLISIFVLALLVYICLRFNRRANPVPSKTAHNTKLEIIWTVVPVLILVAIAIPSLRLHYFMETDVQPQMTLKVTGYQWYWHYDYPDNGNFGFDSYIKKDKDLQPGDVRMLAVDNHAVVPVNTKVRVLITGADVIHSFSVPAFGIKRDAVPGKLNETWFEATKTGTFYGQCSQLCGVGHGFMPIVVDVVSKEDYSKWAADKQKENGASASASSTTTPLAKPNNEAKENNPSEKISAEKSNSEQTGEGKPSNKTLKAEKPAGKTDTRGQTANKSETPAPAAKEEQ